MSYEKNNVSNNDYLKNTTIQNFNSFNTIKNIKHKNV